MLSGWDEEKISAEPARLGLRRLDQQQRRLFGRQSGELPGKIVDIVKTGRFRLLDALKKKLPGQVGDMAALPGLGPKRVKLLYDKLKIRTLDDLRAAVKAGRRMVPPVWSAFIAWSGSEQPIAQRLGRMGPSGDVQSETSSVSTP